jgi:hypothetical protein
MLIQLLKLFLGTRTSFRLVQFLKQDNYQEAKLTSPSQDVTGRSFLINQLVHIKATVFESEVSLSCLGSWSSSVSIVTRLQARRLKNRDSIAGRSRDFSLLHRAETGSGAPDRWVPWTLSTDVEWPGHEADHSPPSNVKVNNAQNYTFTIRLHGVVLY